MIRRIYACSILLTAAACSDFVEPVPPGTFASISGGWQHTCALLGSGFAYCWGRNISFELGTGRTNEHDSLPQPVASPLTFIRIDAGQRHSCGIATGGAAYCWGLGDDGQLGSDTATVTTTPVPVDGGLSFKAITLGMRHSCALTNAGAAYCWGDNVLGQLGRDTTVATVTRPVPVAGALTFTTIAAGDYHTCGIATGGLAYCWGDDVFGAIGNGDTVRTSKAPVAVAGNHRFKAIDGGNVHTCAIAVNGDAYCWGAGGFGQLGNGARTEQTVPVRVTGGQAYGAVSAGANHSCALNVDGRLFCWGSDGSGQLAATPGETCVFGPGPSDNFPCTSNPIAAASGHYFNALSAGAGHTCAVEFGGGAFCWGANSDGQVGNGTVGNSVLTPARVPDPDIAAPLN